MKSPTHCPPSTFYLIPFTLYLIPFTSYLLQREVLPSEDQPICGIAGGTIVRLHLLAFVAEVPRMAPAAHIEVDGVVHTIFYQITDERVVKHLLFRLHDAEPSVLLAQRTEDVIFSYPERFLCCIRVDDLTIKDDQHLTKAHPVAVGGGVEIFDIVGREVPFSVVEGEGSRADGFGRTLVKMAVTDVPAANVVVRKMLQALRRECRPTAIQNVIAVWNPLAANQVQ